MNVDDEHIQEAKKVLRNGGSVPAAAGAVSNIAPDAEKNYLFAAANKARIELEE